MLFFFTPSTSRNGTYSNFSSTNKSCPVISHLMELPYPPYRFRHRPASALCLRDSDSRTDKQPNSRCAISATRGHIAPKRYRLPESTEPIDGLLAIKAIGRKQRRRKFRPIDRIGIPLADDGNPLVIPVAPARLRFGASATQAVTGIKRHAGLRR